MIAEPTQKPTYPTLPPPPADNAPDAEWDAYLQAVQAATVKHVPVLMTLDAAKQAQRACRYVLSHLDVSEHAPHAVPLRAAASLLDRAITARQDANGQESLTDALADDPTYTDQQRIYWLRVVCAAQERELAEMREGR